MRPKDKAQGDMLFCRLPSSRKCVAPVGHSGPSLTNESAEAITRPPRTGCGATARLEDASDWGVTRTKDTRKVSVSDVVEDIKSRLGGRSAMH